MGLIYGLACRSFEGGLTGKYAKVISRLPVASSVLEVGCYTGFFTRILLDNKHSVLGIEKDKQAVEVAKTNRMPVKYGDIEDESLILSIEEKFDVVLFIDVLEHLNSPQETLKRVKLLLKKGGRIMVTCPNVAYWSVRKNILLGRWDYKDGTILDSTHLHFYTASGWRSLIENSGYTIMRFESAEGMIPLEHILSKIPLINSIIALLRNKMIQLWPNLFTIVYFIEAIPEALPEKKGINQ